MLVKPFEALKVPQITQTSPPGQSEGHEKYSPPMLSASSFATDASFLSME
jgi:hypothetical protein